jgi:acetate kinase
VINLVKQFGYTIDQANDIILKKSGMLGLSEHSNDMREIENAINNNCEKSLNALQVYAYRIKKYIGAYIAAMNGCDLIIFTGGVGENMALLRQMVLEDMSFFGINLCLEKNKIFSGEIENLTAAGSKVTILKVPTNEELQIAIETEMVVGGGL